MGCWNAVLSRGVHQVVAVSGYLQGIGGINMGGRMPPQSSTPKAAAHHPSD